MSTNFGISTESPVLAGKVLKGTIYGEVTKEISAKEFRVELKGIEKSHVTWTETTGSGDHRYETTRYGDAQRPIIQASTSVLGNGVIQNGKILPGKYQIPFEIPLPDTLPSSIRVHAGMQSAGASNNMQSMIPTSFGAVKQSMQGGGQYSSHQAYCEIEYEIKVRVMGSGVFANYHCQTPIMVHAKPIEPDTPKIPFEGPPDTKKITTCCCIGEGTVMFGCLADNTMVTAGHEIVVSMGCRNNSKKELTSVDAQLVQVVKWSARGHESSNSQVLCTRNFGSWGDLKAKSDLVSRDLPEFEEGKHIYEEMKAGDHAVKLTLPPNPLSSYKGDLIEIKHELQVVVQTEGCCTSNPTIIIPVLVREGVSSVTPSAAIIPEAYANAFVASLINMAGVPMQVGGNAIQLEEGQNEDEIVFPGYETGVIDLKTLLEDMARTTSDKDLVESRLRDPAWLPIFTSLKESDFAQVISKVDMDFYQAAVASMIAAKIPNFTCSYVTALFSVVKDWNRAQIVEQLLPYCKDLKENHMSIKNKLSAWDQTVTEQAFQNALNK